MPPVAVAGPVRSSVSTRPAPRTIIQPMRIGFGLPVSGAWATADNVGRFAVRAEELGYRSLWAFQRVLVGADQDLDPVYRSVLDPLTALAFAAARTSTVRLG